MRRRCMGGGRGSGLFAPRFLSSTFVNWLMAGGTCVQSSACSFLRRAQVRRAKRGCLASAHLQTLGEHTPLALDAHVLGPLHVAVQRSPRSQSLPDACARGGKRVSRCTRSRARPRPSRRAALFDAASPAAALVPHQPGAACGAAPAKPPLAGSAALAARDRRNEDERKNAGARRGEDVPKVFGFFSTRASSGVFAAVVLAALATAAAGAGAGFFEEPPAAALGGMVLRKETHVSDANQLKKHNNDRRTCLTERAWS